MRYLTISALGTALSLILTSGAFAATVNISTETGAAMETVYGFPPSAFDSTNTRGTDLAGAQVTATFKDGTTGAITSETLTWLAFNLYQDGGVNGLNWSLFQQGTPTVSLVSIGRLMTSLTIDLSTSQSVRLSSDAVPVLIYKGASVFDITPADENAGSTASTLGTEFGSAFEFDAFSAPTGSVEVTYSGAVNIVGAPAVGDIFTTMKVDFTGLDGGGFMGSTNYSSDQDTLLVPGDLVPVSPVPLPAGLPMLVAALGGLALLRRRIPA